MDGIASSGATSRSGAFCCPVPAQGDLGGVVGGEEQLDADLLERDIARGAEGGEGREERELSVIALSDGVAEAQGYEEVETVFVAFDGGDEGGDVRVGAQLEL